MDLNAETVLVALAGNTVVSGFIVWVVKVVVSRGVIGRMDRIEAKQELLAGQLVAHAEKLSTGALRFANIADDIRSLEADVKELERETRKCLKIASDK